MEQYEIRKEILRLCYNQGFKFLARDKDDSLYVYRVQPKKRGKCWYSDEAIEKLKFSDKLFEDIRFGDKEPLSIAKELGTIDWSVIPRDTKVLVSQDKKHWHKRHFAGFDEKETYKFIVYGLGETSWTSSDRIDDFRGAYKYCKLPEE